MSTDVVALISDRPDVNPVLEGLASRMRLAVSTQHDGSRVYDGTGRLLAIIPGPQLVNVPGEVERLLGDQVRADPPVWWVDIRAAADVEDAARFALACADELVARHGGTVWSGARR